MLWINFLHLYQPANTDAAVIREATERSYFRIVRVMEENDNVKFTANISGCLLLRWEELGFHDLIRRISDLNRSGRLELVGTAAYHPLLPLVSSDEVRRQIEENESILRGHFGADIRLKGFFLPELAYSPRVARIIADKGYEWLILDELAVDGRLGETEREQVYLDKNSGLKVAVRSRHFSSGYVPDICRRILDDGRNDWSSDKTVITATDAELYGLRHIDHTGEFEKFIKRPDVRTATVSELIDGRTGKLPAIKPPKHSWETTEAELAAGHPFLVWQDRNNPIQREMWRFYGFIDKVLRKYNNDNNYEWARWHLVRGLASCTWWWASGRDFKHIFGPVSWNPDQIELGINEMIRAIRALDDIKTRPYKLKAEKQWLRIKDMVWQKHWGHYWKK